MKVFCRNGHPFMVANWRETKTRIYCTLIFPEYGDRVERFVKKPEGWQLLDHRWSLHQDSFNLCVEDLGGMYTLKDFDCGTHFFI